jgi:hypothetical protein
MRTCVRTVLAVSVALLATACESRTDPQPDAGGAVSCNYMGTLYDDGAVFPAADGCNTCKCNPGGTPGRWGCSLKACSTDAGGASGADASPTQCNYMGTIYEDGAEFTAADGCNACKCNPGNTPGRWGCTQRLCVPDAGAVDAGPNPVDAGPDRRRPDDGPPPDFLRPEHPGGFCPIDPPTPGTSCSLEANQGCGYRPVCESGTPVNQYCSCPGGRWACDDGGYCARE